VTLASAHAEAAAPERTWFDRLYAALPLATVFVWLLALYAWEAWGHTSPWLFTDELELTQFSRSIAETGHAARRGDPHFFQTLYAYVLAPAWWIDSVSRAYGVVKYVGVLTMTASVFPAYFLARTIVPPRSALFAAAATGAVPALAYAPMILEEPLAYPYAVLAFLLIAKALATRSRGWVSGAVAASLVAPLVRGELAVIPVVFVLAALAFFMTSEAGRRWRSRWSAWDWMGAIVLTIGAIVVFSAVVGHYSASWFIATGHYRGRMIEYGLWAAGAFTIGIGVLPVVVGLAALVMPRGERRTMELRAFTALLLSSLVAFGLYTAVKAAYISTTFATRVEERNLIYLAPLLFVATALWFERPRLRWVPLACAVGFVAYLIVATPYQLDSVPYADALGLSIAQMANRNLAFSADTAQWVLLGVLAISVALLVAPRLLSRRPGATSTVLATAAVLVLAWNLAGQISAATYSNDTSKKYLAGFPNPPTWLDSVTHGEPALYLGQNLDAGAHLGIWLTEFWNRSLKRVWTLDGVNPPGPGPTLTPDLTATNGLLTQPDPPVSYVMTESGIDLVGDVVATVPHPPGGAWVVYKLRGPLRLAHSQTGITPDGWLGCNDAPCPPAAYNQYATEGGEKGYVTVSVSRRAACGAPIRPGNVLIRVGRLVRGEDKQPHLGRVTAVRRWRVAAGAERQFVIPTPAPPFRVEVDVAPTFSPADYGASDRRQLGAQVGFGFSLTPSRGSQSTCT
jgi:hypothetical protein